MPFQEILTKLNWIDIVVIITIITTAYQGSKGGFVAEIFKLTGIILSVYLSLHYFSPASDLLSKYVPALGVTFSDFICFLLLAVLSYLAAAIIRGVFTRFVKAEATALLDRWGGLLLGLVRGFLAVSMLLLIFYLTTVSYLSASIKKSYIGSRLTLTDVKVYEALFNTLTSKFSPEEKLNKDIYEVLEEKGG